MTVATPRNPLQADPSQTGLLRDKFSAEFRRRFSILQRDILQLVLEEDAFGLKRTTQADYGALPLIRAGNQLVTNDRWRFLTSDQKVLAFQRWLKGRVDQTILDEYKGQEDRYWHAYVDEGYKKGAGKAYDQARKSGLINTTSQKDFYAGGKAEFFKTSFGKESVDKVKLLASRVLTDLVGVTTRLASKLSRALTDGLVQGQNPRTIASTMVKDLGFEKNQADVIARTEVIRAHAEGQLDSLDKLGVAQVGVAVEWGTAGDNRVCKLCAPMEGAVFKVKEAHGLIPRHPRCRCAFLPANVGESSADQLNRKGEIQAAMRRSVRAEIPKKSKISVQQQMKRSRWAGADLNVDKVRPKSLIADDEPTQSFPSPSRVSPLEDRKVQALLAEYNRLQGLKRMNPLVRKEKINKAFSDLKKAGLRYDPSSGAWVDPGAPAVYPPESPFADRKVQAMIAKFNQARKQVIASPTRQAIDEYDNVVGELKKTGLKLDNNTDTWFDPKSGAAAPNAKKLSKVKTEPLKNPYVKARQKWKENLTKEEKEGIKYWSESMYTVQSVRDYSRGVKTLDPEIAAKAKAFFKAVDDAPSYKGTLYRGQELDNLSELKVGGEFEFNEIVSTSKQLDVGEEFAGYSTPMDDTNSVVFEIKSTKAGADISDLVIDDYLDQYEVALKPSTYRVVSKERKYSSFNDTHYTHVVLEEIDGPSTGKAIKAFPDVASKAKGAITDRAADALGMPAELTKFATKEEMAQLSQLRKQRLSLNKKIKAGIATPEEVAEAKRVKDEIAEVSGRMRKRAKAAGGGGPAPKPTPMPKPKPDPKPKKVKVEPAVVSKPVPKPSKSSATLDVRINELDEVEKLRLRMLKESERSQGRIEQIEAEIQEAQAPIEAENDKIKELHNKLRKFEINRFQYERELKLLRNKIHKLEKGIDVKYAELSRVKKQNRAEDLKVLFLDEAERLDLKVSLSSSADRVVREDAEKAAEILSKLTKNDKLKSTTVSVVQDRSLRAGYTSATNSIRVNRSSGLYTNVHELAHHLEHKIPNLQKLAGEFKNMRIGRSGTENVSLRKALNNSAFRAAEVGNPDDWVKTFGFAPAHYVGKTYSSGSTEIFSMGLEYLTRDPVAFARNDPEFFNFIIGALRGML